METIKVAKLQKPKIIIIDDQIIRDDLAKVFKNRYDFLKISSPSTFNEAVDLVNSEFDGVLIDVNLGKWKTSQGDLIFNNQVIENGIELADIIAKENNNKTVAIYSKELESGYIQRQLSESSNNIISIEQNFDTNHNEENIIRVFSKFLDPITKLYLKTNPSINEYNQFFKLPFQKQKKYLDSISDNVEKDSFLINNNNPAWLLFGDSIIDEYKGPEILNSEIKPGQDISVDETKIIEISNRLNTIPILILNSISNRYLDLHFEIVGKELFKLPKNLRFIYGYQLGKMLTHFFSHGEISFELFAKCFSQLLLENKLQVIGAFYTNEKLIKSRNRLTEKFSDEFKVLGLYDSVITGIESEKVFLVDFENLIEKKSSYERRIDSKKLKRVGIEEIGDTFYYFIYESQSLISAVYIEPYNKTYIYSLE